MVGEGGGGGEGVSLQVMDLHISANFICPNKLMICEIS